ncbi:MAG TPA: MoaD/ThiS family protein [Methylibium sp.]|nr:MoaD/ThiS family protein [Methylibium sp.]
MVTVTFTSHLQRHVSIPRHELAQAATLGEALAQVFAANPQARGYILDDQGGLRAHVAVFIDGQRASDPKRLGDPLRPDSEVHVLQALTGG